MQVLEIFDAGGETAFGLQVAPEWKCPTHDATISKTAATTPSVTKKETSQ
jgi:hypothetical protein